MFCQEKEDKKSLGRNMPGGAALQGAPIEGGASFTGCPPLWVLDRFSEVFFDGLRFSVEGFDRFPVQGTVRLQRQFAYKFNILGLFETGNAFPDKANQLRGR